ncbi:MAG: nuclear transport factor 2 family protein, partial [Gammaproteobacteria bacterium]
MANELETIVDQMKVVETINRLFVGTDNRNWALVRSCFAPRVMFDMSSMGAGEPGQLTPEEIVSAWDAGLKPLRSIHHQAGNYLVDVSGTKADAFCYGIASHYLPNKSNRNTRTFVGSYEFQLLKEGGCW